MISLSLHHTAHGGMKKQVDDIMNNLGKAEVEVKLVKKKLGDLEQEVERKYSVIIDDLKVDK